MALVVAQDVIASSVNRVVVGLGVTGLSCARHLYARGIPFTVVDTRSAPPGLAQLRREMPDVTVFAGNYPAEIIDSAVELIVSPGIALDDPIVSRALAADVAVVGDIDLFVREAGAPVVGITGSNAKSTVTELLGQMARDARLNVGVGGNLGTPALDLLADDRELYVLELSSFQLERAGRLDLAVAVVLNVSADHLDRHGTMSNYHQVKHRIFRGCRKAVVNRNDPLTVPLVAADVEIVSWRMGEPELGGFGLRQVDEVETLCYEFDALLPTSQMGLVGRHNVANALSALALGYAAGLGLETMVATLREFAGLPHRCQQVAEIAGVRFVNDSKGTNVGATEAALNGLGEARNIILIAGGQGKGADFSQLQGAVARHCKLLLLIGEDAELLRQALGDVVPVAIESSLDSAVAAAAAQARPGDCVLLSPACASFDMFCGYVERGQAFCQAVAGLPGGRA
ncbi:MAG: UDP-N-acetylmuramoyl-L-alanine--D-glutamate ligase [Gammaproteobacteria bacterium]|nr:MAG: UDP-N-acetylmuramoyl-L-alanine--D-glutamate ligase [Gammaproteobacteria bacterium]RLA61307.1 MAG: UDP-N-acetylmuramoyl-L-alanine--D-glutamate ligase [Gammaproteobacteria bacterium]